MVVIEPVPIPPSEQDREPQPKPTTKSTTAAAATAAPSPSGYNSEGYETASDTELNNETENEEERKTVDPIESENNGATVQAPSSIDDDERAIAQANDAKLDGNALFKEGRYEEALLKYELALQVAPDAPSSAEIRSICHANRGVCFSKLIGEE